MRFIINKIVWIYWILRGRNVHYTAIVDANVYLEKGVQIGAYSVIGSPAEIKTQPQKILGKIYIGRNTIIREHVTIHSPRYKEGYTSIGDSCYIQAHSHIGHDSTISDNVTIACYACIGGHNIVKDRANLGLHVVTHPRSIIGKGVMVGCNSFVKGELKDWGVYVGTPAKWIKQNDYLINKLKYND